MMMILRYTTRTTTKKLKRVVEYPLPPEEPIMYGRKTGNSLQLYLLHEYRILNALCVAWIETVRMM